MKTRWFEDAVIYQIYPRSFKDSNGDGIGDLKGITQKLDYIKSLGVDAIWLSPIYASPNDDNGYDISDYKNIMPEFGTMQDFEEMISEMHKRNIKLIMDLVVNHSSDEHYWFKESRKSKDNPYREYYIWREGRGKNKNKPPNNWRSNFVGSAWQKDEITGEYYLHLFSKKQPDLNWNSEKLRKEIQDICNFWLNKGVDGFRCDVIPYISKPIDLENYSSKKFYNPLRGIEYYTCYDGWMEYMQELGDNSYNKEEYDTLIVGECPNVKFDLASKITHKDNRALDTLFQFEHVNADYLFYLIPHKLHLRKLKKKFDKWNNLPKGCWNSLFYESHDYSRSVSHFGNDKEYRVESAKMLGTSIFFQKATPYIFQGQEIGMTNCPLKENEYKDILSVNIIKKLNEKYRIFKKCVLNILQKRARDHSRTPVQWTANKNADFTSGEPWFIVNPNYKEINVEKALNDKNSIFYYYKNLIEIKHNYSEIFKNGEYVDYNKNNKRIYSYYMKKDNKIIFVICNFFEKKVKFKLNNFDFKKSKLLLSNYDIKNDILEDFELKPYEARVYEITI